MAMSSPSQRFGRRRGRRARDFVGDAKRLVGRAAANREARGDDADRPFVPTARLPAVSAVGIGGALQVLGGILVIAAHERHLRERVVDGAGRFVELHRAADFERAVQHRFGAREIADAHADLAKRRKRHGQPWSLAETFLQRDRALGECQRLIVAVANERDVCLVDADRRERVIGAERGRLSLGETQRRGRLVVAAVLREHHARERVHEREMAAVAGGVERRGRFGDVLTHNRVVADLPVAERQLVVGQADGARVVRDLRLLERAAVKGDGARLFPARVGHAAVQPPQRREQDRRNGFAQCVRCAAEGGAGLR